MNKIRILFVTTSQPSINPRLRKSAETLAQHGHEVHVLFAHRRDWAIPIDEDFIRGSLCDWQRVGGGPNERKLLYFLSRIERKAWEIIGNQKRAHCRGYNGYIRRGLKLVPNLIIGHNPGALGPVVELSKRLEVPCVFDAEDFHRGEFLEGEDCNRSNNVKKLEEAFIPQLTFATGASPLIVRAYQELFPKIPWTTVNNAFPTSLLQSKPTTQTGALKVVWFSQVVGLDRGLLEFLDGMKGVPSIPIELTIIGDVPALLKTKILSYNPHETHKLTFKEPCPENELFAELQRHEIGLALEVPKTKNRDFCRTNKLYAYPLCGVHMFVSQTAAQVDFIQQYPDAGEIIDLNNPQSIASSLFEAYDNRNALLAKREAAWELGRTKLNWEFESQSLLHAINQIIES